MSQQITRYEFRPGNVGDGEPDQCLSEDGAFVSYDDYAALQTQFAASEAQVTALGDKLKWANEKIIGYGQAITSRYGEAEFGDLSESALQDAKIFENLQAQVTVLKAENERLKAPVAWNSPEWLDYAESGWSGDASALGVDGFNALIAARTAPKEVEDGK